MSDNYSEDRANAVSKQESREKIAADIQRESGFSKIAIHYLGGEYGDTSFENEFKSRMKRSCFFRYEKKRKAKVPHSYVNYLGIWFAKSTGHFGRFIEGNFFKWFDWAFSQTKNLPQYLWLDFCGAPTHTLINQLRSVVFPIVESKNGVCYITFWMNVRNCSNSKRIFGSEKNIDRCANLLKQYFQYHICGDMSCEVFDTYMNGPSKMAVLKFQNMKNKTKKTVQDYVALAKQGYSNKQIAVYWRMGLMQVAGFNASAKRQGLV